jgi:hypothetical protein
MNVVTSLRDDRSLDFALDGICPHCRAHTVLQRVTGIYTEPSQDTMNHRYPSRSCAAMRCPGCHKYVLAVVTRNPDSNWFSHEAHYPMGTPDQTVSDDIRSDDIKADFREALRCRFVDAYNATVEMCRRAIETSCLELGAPKGLDVNGMIDWVHLQGKITSVLKDTAHKIRLAGNRGAHPSPRVITPEDADAVIEFSRQYFDHVYVHPARLARFDFSKKEIPPSPAEPGP